MSTTIAKPARVAIIGASGTYGKGILARAEEIGVEAVVITRSPHEFKDVKSTTTVVEGQLDEEEKLKEAFTGCDGAISALGDDRKKRPKTHNLPHVWNAMKAAGVTKHIGMGSRPMMMPGEKPGGFQRAVHPLLSVLKLFGVDMLEQNEWECDSLLRDESGPQPNAGLLSVGWPHVQGRLRIPGRSSSARGPGASFGIRIGPPFPRVPTWAANWARRNRCEPHRIESAVAADVTRLVRPLRAE